MSLFINHNIPAINAGNNLKTSNQLLARSLERLSSGLRINRASDDAAGLTISEKMRSQIFGLNQAIKNAQDGISMIQTAEGATNEIHSILQRMRTLSVQASSDVNTDEDRQAIQAEIDQLKEEIDRISDTTEFNTRKLLNGSSGILISDATSAGGTQLVRNMSGTADTQGGVLLRVTSMSTASQAILNSVATATYSAGSSITINNTTLTLSQNTTNIGVTELINEISGETGVQATLSPTGVLTLSSLDVGSNKKVELTNVSGTFATAFIATNRLAYGTNASIGIATADIVNITSYRANGNSIEVLAGNLKGLKFIVQASYTAGGAVTRDVLRTGTNNAMRVQVGANSEQTISVSIRSLSASSLGINQLNVTSHAGASSAIQEIDNAIASVSLQRSSFGAIQNRLEHTITNLGVSEENMTAAESRIRDADIAYETMQYTRNQILIQAGTSILGQANIIPSSLLALLG